MILAVLRCRYCQSYPLQPTRHLVLSVPSSSRLFALLVAASLGCVSTPAPVRIPSPSTPREPERIPAPLPTAKSLPNFVYRDGTYTYDLRQTTTVTVGVDSGTLTEDTLQTIAGLTYSISANAGAPVVSAMIDSLVITSKHDTLAPVRRLAAPVVVQLPLLPFSVATAVDSTALLSTCDSMEETARALAGDLYIQIPVPVQEAQSWSDSTSLVLCRGGIPLTATRISRFYITEVRESRDSVLAKVLRQTSLTITGSGTQSARRITVRGQGTSETAFTYDLRAGRFLESTGQSVLQLGFETIQQTEQVIQRSNSSVRLRAGVPSGLN